jgi:APA family basic amino acid/polyamine antiporter
MAGLLPIDESVKLVNIGTLFAFTLVCLAIPFLRISDPDRKRPFRAPFSPVVPILGASFALMLMFSLPSITWYRFIIWLGIGLLIYANYGYHKSKLMNQQNGQ